MSYFTAEQFKTAAATGAVFFDWDLKPVTPKEGQWFCEFELTIPEDSAFPEYVQDEAIVRFECFEEHTNSDGETKSVAVVWDDNAADVRQPRTQVLVLQ